MDRAVLLRILDDSDAAQAAARAAVERGAPFQVDTGSVPAARLAAIYNRRERHSRRMGQDSVGFAAAVSELAACGDRPVRIGAPTTARAAGFAYGLHATGDHELAIEHSANRRQVVPLHLCDHRWIRSAARSCAAVGQSRRPPKLTTVSG